MSSICIYVIRHVFFWLAGQPAILLDKILNIMLKLFTQIFFIATMVIGTIVIYHFLPFSGLKGQQKAKPISFIVLHMF